MFSRFWIRVFYLHSFDGTVAHGKKNDRNRLTNQPFIHPSIHPIIQLPTLRTYALSRVHKFTHSSTQALAHSLHTSFRAGLEAAPDSSRTCGRFVGLHASPTQKSCISYTICSVADIESTDLFAPYKRHTH